MRLPMSSSFESDADMSTSNICSIKLPYLGTISLGKSPLNLTSFQKHLRELYLSFDQESTHDQRRIVISNSDISIFEPGAAEQAKRTFIYANFESIVDVQILKFSVRQPNETNQQIQAAFFPIGCENEERFRSLYSIIPPSQLNRLASTNVLHPPLLLFVIRKAGLGDSSSLLDCHVFVVHRELRAFELCNMIRKLIVKRTMSPLVMRRRTLICKAGLSNDDLLSNVKINDVDHSLLNPFSSSSIVIAPVQQQQQHYHHNHHHHSSSSSSSSSCSNETSKVLTINRDMTRVSSPSKQRHFVKASKFLEDESDEIVNDLMNLVATETLKTQNSFKRHASSEQLSCSDESIMNRKRYFHNKKRLLNPSPTQSEYINQWKAPPRVQGQLVRPEIVINRYGDIGNYVPKFLRENITTRSSDSNENIFFRSNNGQLINGFLQLDILSTKSTQENCSQSTPCLNQGTPQRTFEIEINPSIDDHRVPHISKSFADILHPQLASSNRPKRVASFTIADSQSPMNYRQYLRHTDQGVHLYGEGKRQQTTLEHSLGYFP